MSVQRKTFCAVLICLSTTALSHAMTWPPLPTVDGASSIPAQPWPQKPGDRQVRVVLAYPGGTIQNIKATTGLMLSLHNWGGTGSVGTADPSFLTQRYDVVAICVDYLQSGKYEPNAPYDFGYLQSLDSLRALWWVFDGLVRERHAFDRGRIYAVGGSGGGNVALMVNKLAPRTFAAVIDMSGMVQLSDDIAFNLDGGSRLNAGYSRDPASPAYLSRDAQDIRFIGHPEHLAALKRLGNTCKVIVSHGSTDNVCPVQDAREMVANMQAAGIDVEPHFITRADLDGTVFKDTGHAVGNRTLIVDRLAGKYLSPSSPVMRRRSTPCDFELREEKVRYATPAGVWVISYTQGFPVGRFESKGQPSVESHDR